MNARNQSRKRGSNKKKQTPKNKKGKVDPKKFWGDPEALPSPEGFEISTPDPVAVVTSLGQPPLPGHGAASPHYFKLVYGRSTQLAAALAMAGGIEDLTPEPVPEPDELDELDTEEGNEASPSESSVDEEKSGNERASTEADADESE